MSDNKDKFGTILTVLGFGFFTVSAFVIWVFLFSDFAFVHSLEPDKRIDSGIKALTTIGAGFGGIALLTNAYYASRTAKAANENAKAANENAEIAREKQITERFAKAIELLGSQQLEVKLGGIYALEQIAKDSPEKYHWTIMEVLTAFVRENAPLKKVAKEDEGKIPKLRTDIQAALTVIGRRNYENEQENQTLDLGNIDIRGANLEGANLQRVHLMKADLQGANLYQANLQGADFSEADLQGAKLYAANLQGAILSQADLQGAKLYAANLQGAILSQANLQNANLINADLQNAKLLKTHLQKADLREAKLQGADLAEAKLQGTILYQANLQGAILYQAKLQEAILYQADLEEANLSQAKLQGAKFTSAKNLTSQEVELAEGDENTILPDYITRPKHWTKSE